MARILTASLIICVCAALIGSVTAREPRKIAGWGAVVDPDGDCTITQEGGRVTIKLPDTLHDFWALRSNEKKRFNSPRVWQQVDGDFVAQVKVTANWKSAGPPSPTNAQYIGAGLVICDSEKQYIRLERNLMDTQRFGLIGYSTPLQDRDGKRVNAWKTAKADFFKGDSTWLRIERAGEKLTTSISHDGKEWIGTGVLSTDLPRIVRVGVLAVNCSCAEFVANFDDYRLTKK